MITLATFEFKKILIYESEAEQKQNKFGKRWHKIAFIKPDYSEDRAAMLWNDSVPLPRNEWITVHLELKQNDFNKYWLKAYLSPKINKEE